ncbi:unnamed protein product, partial [Urochloa humidicola]
IVSVCDADENGGKVHVAMPSSIGQMGAINPGSQGLS